MKRVIASMLLVSLAVAGTPAVARAESVFESAVFPPVALRIAHPDGPRGFGAAASLAAGGPGLSPDPAGDARPSTLKCAGSSLLLPGFGQYKLGHRLSSKIYFGLEGLSWLAVGTSIWAGYARERSYKDYAVAYADVAGTDHSGDYYEKIGQYMSNDGPGGYNETVRRDARDLYYPDVAAMDAYYEANKIAGDDGWRWRDSGAYRRYGSLRDGSRFAYRVALYSAVFAGALRIVSAADAVRLSRRASPAREGGTVSLGFDANPRGPSLYVQKSF